MKTVSLEHFPTKWMPVGRKKVLKANNRERRSDLIRSSSALVIATLLLVTPVAAEEASPSARYSMTPIEGGALRLDTLTGAVDRCVAEAGVWSCRALPDEGRALQDEIDRLAAENAELRGKLPAGGDTTTSGAADHSRPTMSFHLPSEAEVDKAMDFMERILKRFKSMAKDLDEEDGKGTAL